MSIKEVRKQLNLTQDQMAEMLGTNRSNISDMERGVEIPEWLGKAITLHRILTKAGYSLDDLILSLPDPVETTAINAVKEKPKVYHTNKRQNSVDVDKVPMKS